MEDNDSGPPFWNKLKEKKCRIPISKLAELLAEEKKLLKQKKKEQDALKQKLRAVKKQRREEERKLNERRAGLVGRCMMQKFNSYAEAKETILQDFDGFLAKREDRELFGLAACRTFGVSALF